MCDLCSSDAEEREAAEDRHESIARRLKGLAGYYRAMAFREMDPHTGEPIHNAKVLARGLVRELVGDWV